MLSKKCKYEDENRRLKAEWGRGVCIYGEKW
jgi:hypothetical protein